MRLKDLKHGTWCYVDLGRNEPYGERYVITIDGKLYSNMDNFKRVREELKEIYTETDKKGYKKVKLYDLTKKSHMRRIHRIVLESFTREMGKPIFDEVIFPDCFTVDHMDGNTNNNHLENLRWLSYGENTASRKNNYTSWSEELKTAICELYFKERLSASRISRILRKNKGTISSFLHGDIHTGYVKEWCEKNNIEYKIDVFSKGRDWKIEEPAMLRIVDKYSHLRYN